jgi:hypothetical protein
VTRPAATWPQIPARTTSGPTPPLAITLDTAYPCGEAVELALHYAADQGSGTIELPVAVGSPVAPVLSSDTPVFVAGGDGTESTLTLTGDDRVQDLEVHIPTLSSLWVGQVSMTTSPAGTTVRLMDGPGAGWYGAWGPVFKDLVLSDDAPTAIEDLPDYPPPAGYGGRRRPDESLGAFDGEPRAGTWTLHATDKWGDSATYLQAWGLAAPGGARCNSDPNRRPLAHDDVATGVVSERTAHGASVLANDGDLDGDALTAVLARPPAHGTLALAADGTFTYTSDRLYEGADSFTYRARDAKTVSRAATVRIDVAPRPNVAPVAAADAYTALYGIELSGATVLANDSDGDRDPLTADVVRYPDHGSLGMGPDGRFGYLADSSFSGTDTFTYRAGDGRATSEVTLVTIRVKPPNRAPLGSADRYDVVSGSVLTGHSVLDNDGDPDGDPLGAIRISPTWHGTLALDPRDGTFTYRPDDGFVGTDGFDYVATDGPARSGRVAVTFVVSLPNIGVDGFGVALARSADLVVQRAALGGGRLDVRATIDDGATGPVAISLRTGATTTRWRATIAGGRIRLTKALRGVHRRARSGVVRIAYAGTARVAAEAISLRAEPRAARLKLASAKIDGRLGLRAHGTISSRARGSLRVRFVPTAGGAVNEVSYTARIGRGRWSLPRYAGLTRAVAARGGELTIQYAGDAARHVGGAQVTMHLAGR